MLRPIITMGDLAERELRQRRCREEAAEANKRARVADAAETETGALRVGWEIVDTSELAERDCSSALGVSNSSIERAGSLSQLNTA